MEGTWEVPASAVVSERVWRDSPIQSSRKRALSILLIGSQPLRVSITRALCYLPGKWGTGKVGKASKMTESALPTNNIVLSLKLYSGR